MLSHFLLWRVDLVTGGAVYRAFSWVKFLDLDAQGDNILVVLFEVVMMAVKGWDATVMLEAESHGTLLDALGAGGQGP